MTTCRMLALGLAVALAGATPAAAGWVEDDHFAAERCDRLAAFERTRDRAPVRLAAIDAEATIEACARAAAEADDPARYLLQLARGHIRARDWTKAALNLESASELGSAAAMFILAQMHHSGQGLARDIVLAHDLYTRALDRGYRRAAIGLVILHEQEGALHDPEAALELRRSYGLEGRELPALP